MLDIVDLFSAGFCRTPTVCLYSHQTMEANEALLIHRRWTRSRILAWHGVDRTESQ